MSTLSTPASEEPREGEATRRQIRGSTMLLAGRFLSIGINFAVQVLMVRYLSKSAYGAFAYVLSLVTLGQGLVTFGLDRAITRFVPIYHEDREYDKMFGTIFVVLSLILALSLLLILGVFALRVPISQHLVTNQQVMQLLLILVLLVPFESFDILMVGLFAVFASPRAIFFRKYLLGPGLKLAVVLLLTLMGESVNFLAGGYLLASMVGVFFYVVVLIRLLHDQGLFRHLRPRAMQLPMREILLFTTPLLTSDLVYAFTHSIDSIMLANLRGTGEVAAFRAVQPTATLNHLVYYTFSMLFTPIAARLFARRDTKAINNLYWQTAVWVAVLSFPVFAMTFSLARPLTVFMFEERYASSATVLAILAIGHYFDSMLGPNGLTLKVFGVVRYIVIIDLFAMATSVVLNLLLIPPLGALGAAIGTASTFVMLNLLRQFWLRRATGINSFQREYRRVYASIFLAAGLLVLVQLFWTLPFLALAALATLTSAGVLLFNRAILDVENTFPELLRFPLMQRLFGSKAAKPLVP